MDERQKIENGGAEPRFYSVADAARLIGTAPVTLYRAIRDGEFPAIRIRGRLIVPAKAIEAMADAAVAAQSTVDLADTDFVAVRRGAEG